MKTIKSTAEILALKVLKRPIDKTWFCWATEMMCEGFQTENLIYLAGITETENQFYLQGIAEKALNELGLEYSNKEDIILKYIRYLIEEVLKNRKTTQSLMITMDQLYTELKGPHFLIDYYLLANAYIDLQYRENQWYLPNIDRNNIHEKIGEYFLL